jgi:hypothetical protein
MKIMCLGLDFTGRHLFKPMDDEDVIRALINAMEDNADHVQSLSRTTAEAVSYRGERQRATFDPGDPRAAGWTYLVNAADPRRQEIAMILEPLAKHRGMADPTEPLLYNGESSDDWFNWLHDNYYALDLEGVRVPQYILVVGGPTRVPFLFQAVLGTVANVGRVDFDKLDDLRDYVAKLIRIETTAEPLVAEEAILFAPDVGLPDPTYFSRQYMVEPLAEQIRHELRFETHTLIGDDATKANLLDILRTKKPALVYTASHGLGATDASVEIQKRYNGSICCQHRGALTLDSLFSADDVPLEQAFLEGAVFFQFACFGYGTPAQSDYAHWIEGVPKRYTDADFVAALPKKLLAHPKGPIAFIGHLDTAFLHGFADVEAPHILERWHARIAPFKKAAEQLLAVQPSGFAMHDMSTRYSVCNALITHTYDQQRRRRLSWNARLKARFLDNWITRGDAQNYMVFGDPATRLRIPTH